MDSKLLTPDRLKHEILELLANDYEDLDQLSDLLGQAVPPERLEEALRELIREGLVGCFRPSKTELRPVRTPDLSKLHTYWFALTEEGERRLHGRATA
jgi:hypothetical protein